MFGPVRQHSNLQYRLEVQRRTRFIWRAALLILIGLSLLAMSSTRTYGRLIDVDLTSTVSESVPSHVFNGLSAGSCVVVGDFRACRNGK